MLAKKSRSDDGSVVGLIGRWLGREDGPILKPPSESELPNGPGDEPNGCGVGLDMMGMAVLPGLKRGLGAGELCSLSLKDWKGLGVVDMALKLDGGGRRGAEPLDGGTVGRGVGGSRSMTD